MFPTDDASIAALGESAETLLRVVGKWLVRRKESVKVLDETLVRRYMSVDFDLPRSVEPTHKTAGGLPVSYAPLFFLQKGSDDLPPPSAIMTEPQPHFANFDLRDAANTAMSLPPRTWNASVSIAAMQTAMVRASESLGIPIPDDNRRPIDEVLENIARRERNVAVQLLEDFTGNDPLHDRVRVLRDLLREDQTFRWLVSACAVSSVAMVPLVGQQARQGIVKLAFNQQIATFDAPAWRRPGDRLRWEAKNVAARLGWAGYELWIDTPFTAADTYHVEVAAPNGLEIYDTGLLRLPEEVADPTGDEARQPADYKNTLSRASGLATEVHLYAPTAGSAHGTLTWVRLRARRQEFVGGAAAVAAVVSLVLWLGYFLADQVKTSPAGIPELLLLFPGAIATYVGRPGRHGLTTRMLFTARLLLMLVSATPYVAAAALALTERRQGKLVGDTFETWWLVLAIVASVGAGALLLTRILPWPQLRVQRIADRVGASWGYPSREVARRSPRRRRRNANQNPPPADGGEPGPTGSSDDTSAP
jgi:hypothetical protein